MIQVAIIWIGILSVLMVGGTALIVTLEKWLKDWKNNE